MHAIEGGLSHTKSYEHIHAVWILCDVRGILPNIWGVAGDSLVLLGSSLAARVPVWGVSGVP